MTTTDEDLRAAAEIKCGVCGLPIHPQESGVRRFRLYIAHSEQRCVSLLRGRLAEAETRIQEVEKERDAARKPNRDAMISRSDEDWQKLEDAVGTLWGLQPGHVLTEADVEGLRHMDTCHRDDEEAATEAYHRGREEGLRERGGDELVRLHERHDEAVVAKAAERALRLMAETRAEAAERERDRLRAIIERDRTRVADGLNAVTKAIGSRAWMREPTRGSYAWDDERYQQEFGQALDEIDAALSDFRILAADWSDCPTDPLEIAEARAGLNPQGPSK